MIQNQKPKTSHWWIAGVLTVAMLPSTCCILMTVFVAGVFALIQPLFLLIVAACLGGYAFSLLSQGLILSDIVKGKPCLSRIRIGGSLLFLLINWYTAFALIKDGSGNASFSDSWFFILATQTAIIAPVLTPLTTVFLMHLNRSLPPKNKVVLCLLYFACFPLLWYAGTTLIFNVAESLTHSNATRIAKEQRDTELAKTLNTAYYRKCVEIYSLDPVADATKTWKEYGELYLPWSLKSSYPSFEGIPKSPEYALLYDTCERYMLSKHHIIEPLSEKLAFPDKDDGVGYVPYTQEASSTLADAKRKYLKTFNITMMQLAGRVQND